MASEVWCVILSWNGKEETLACLETIEKQVRQPDVLLVIDNGSHDGLETPLKKRFPKVRYKALKENRGFAGGMNYGMNLALQDNADFVFIPSNDTLLDPKCLEKLVGAMERNPEVAAAAPKIFLYEPANAIYFNGGYFSKLTLKPSHPGENKPDNHPNEAENRKTDFINGCAPIYRAKALKTVGLFESAYVAYFEDADLSMRLTRAGWTLLMVPAATVIHKHGVSYAKNADAKLKGTVSPIKWQLAIRNHLWFIKKNGSWINKSLGLSIIVIRSLIIAAALVLRGQLSKAMGVLKGLFAGLVEKIDIR